MQSLYKIIIVTFFLSFSYLSLAENGNITKDTNRKSSTKCFIRFDNSDNCIPTNTINDNLPNTQ
ncbi:hypothetical protein CBG25_00490 [Arsenophonus sp. ENCA]|nr:hypothetical protein CBG25_00490 [Arsenophonus sp. ENCA]